MYTSPSTTCYISSRNIARRVFFVYRSNPVIVASVLCWFCAFLLVRRRRADYLGVEMSYRLIRGFPLDRVVDAYRHLGPDEEPGRMIEGKYLVDLRPVENSRSTMATRKKSTLQKASCTFQRLHDYGETYYLVVRAERKWAPANERQNFAVVVSMAAEEPRLYRLLQERVRPAVRIRARG